MAIHNDFIIKNKYFTKNIIRRQEHFYKAVKIFRVWFIQVVIWKIHLLRIVPGNRWGVIASAFDSPLALQDCSMNWSNNWHTTHWSWIVWCCEDAGSFSLNWSILINTASTLAGVAQWIQCQSANQRVAGSIPSQGTTGLQARSPAGGVWEATNWCFSTFFSLPSPL